MLWNPLQLPTMTLTSIRTTFAATSVLLTRATWLVAAALVESTETTVSEAVANSCFFDRGTYSQNLARFGGRGGQ